MDSTIRTMRQLQKKKRWESIKPLYAESHETTGLLRFVNRIRKTRLLNPEINRTVFIFNPRGSCLGLLIAARLEKSAGLTSAPPV
jgi:hypothetical protein